jgi:hypothetical protein
MLKISNEATHSADQKVPAFRKKLQLFLKVYPKSSNSKALENLQHSSVRSLSTCYVGCTYLVIHTTFLPRVFEESTSTPHSHQKGTSAKAQAFEMITMCGKTEFTLAGEVHESSTILVVNACNDTNGAFYHVFHVQIKLSDPRPSFGLQVEAVSTVDR